MNIKAMKPLDDILLEACELFGVRKDEAVSKSRKKYLVLVRSYFVKQATVEGYNSYEISAVINRERTCVNHLKSLDLVFKMKQRDYLKPEEKQRLIKEVGDARDYISRRLREDKLIAY